MMTPTDDLITRIQVTLQDASAPPWLPTLTPDLVAAGWHRLERDLRLTRDSYGTARVLSRDPEETRWLVASLDTQSSYGVKHDSIQIEMLPEHITQQWSNPGFRFFKAQEIQCDGVTDRVEDAIKLLAGVPTMLATVCSLIRSIHVLDTSDDRVDVSFSEPIMPFSVFISVPGPGARDGIFRVAEGMLHEAMHLQLTLIEGFVPLVEPTERTYFSPWRDENRTPAGVLHALYVFRVIDAFLEMVSLVDPVDLTLRRYARERREMIAHQVQEIHEFRECADLTVDGVAFVERLL